MSWGQLAQQIDRMRHEPVLGAPSQRRSLAEVIDAQILAQSSGTAAVAGFGMPAVYGAVRLISSTVVQLPMTVEPTGELPRWLRRPDILGHWDQGDLVQWVITSMALNGAAWLLVTRIGDGWKLDPLHPAQITMRAVDEEYNGYHIRRPAYQIEGRDIGEVPTSSPDDHRSYLLHVPYQVTPDYPQGVGPLQAAHMALDGYVATEHHASTLFESGTHSGGRLESDQDITASTAVAYQDKWVENRKTGKIPVLGQGFRYVNDIISAADAQWIEARQFSQAQIWLMYGIPPDYMGATMTGGGSSLSYANAQDNDRRFRRNCLASFTQQAEEGLSKLLPPGRNAAEDQRVVFDYSGWEGETSGTDLTADPAGIA